LAKERRSDIFWLLRTRKDPKMNVNVSRKVRGSHFDIRFVARRAPVRQEPRRRLVTRAELAECSCPEPCERDHANE
jgi:hypothetical protein